VSTQCVRPWNSLPCSSDVLIHDRRVLPYFAGGCAYDEIAACITVDRVGAVEDEPNL